VRRDELTTLLRKEFKTGHLCGVEKIDMPGYENLWFVVPPAPPRMLPKKLPVGSIARANRIIVELPLHKDADELDKMVSYLFVRREAVESSRMEGTWSTMEHVLTPGDLYDRNEGRSERATVLGYAHALEQEFSKAILKGVSVFSIDLVRRLHSEIMSKDPYFKGRPGCLREHGKPGAVVFIGSLARKEAAVYNPAPPRHVARCLGDVLSWMRDQEIVELGDAGMGMSLPVRMAIGHSHFEAVHPFSDGNGRVGRMLQTLQIICTGRLPLYLSGYIESEKQQYVFALQQAQKKLQYDALVEFISEAIIAAWKEAEQTKDLLRVLPEQWRGRGEFREGSAAQCALSFLITHPIFTVSGLRDLCKVSAPAANRAAEQLVKAKIVRERTGSGRNRVFAAEEVIQLLSRRFSDDPAIALERAKDML
jgi:Fic family protein